MSFFLIWTTTPWTIPFNLAIMATDIDYVKVKVGKEKWVLAKELAGKVIPLPTGEEPQVLEEFKGTKLEGQGYSHPFEKFIPAYAELKKKTSKSPYSHPQQGICGYQRRHRFSAFRPGCGPEDQEACKPYKIPHSIRCQKMVFSGKYRQIQGIAR